MILSFILWNSSYTKQQKKNNDLRKNRASFQQNQVQKPYQRSTPQILLERNLQFHQSDCHYVDRTQDMPVNFRETQVSIFDQPADYLDIGGSTNSRKRCKSFTQKMQRIKMRRRDRSERRPETQQVINPPQFSEFDDLDEISNDSAQLAIQNLPKNRLITRQDSQ